jgi:cytidylate kinase
MRCSAERLIEAIIATEVMQMQRRAAEEKMKRGQKSEVFVVTISRDFGSLGKEVAQLLADTLEVRCCDRSILQEVARRANVDEDLVSALDEHVSSINDHWWQHLMNKDTFSYEDYYRYLVKTVLSISRGGGVIVGRGANHILGEAKAFRVRICGSEEQCARRIAEREGITLEESARRVREVNHERAEYIKMLYHEDINDNTSYDLVLNSDQHDIVQLTGMILDAMEKAGYELPVDARNLLSQTH